MNEVELQSLNELLKQERRILMQRKRRAQKDWETYLQWRAEFMDWVQRKSHFIDAKHEFLLQQLRLKHKRKKKTNN